MNLGNNLFHARKKAGLSQETVAEKLGVSRQTISKWETAETVPDIYEAKKLAKLYNLSLDELIEFNIDVKEIEEVIKNTNEEKEAKIVGQMLGVKSILSLQHIKIKLIYQSMLLKLEKCLIVYRLNMDITN